MAPIELAKGRTKFVAVNSSWRLCPWAEALYAGDYAWWAAAGGCPEFPGLKVSIDRRACDEWGLRRLECSRADDRLEVSRLGTVGWGGNSGFGALNFVAQLRPRKILLVGYDMTLAAGSHWHGPHGDGLTNPKAGNVERWRRCIDAAAKQIAEMGVAVINCSPVSALRRYPKMSLAEALEA